MTVSGIDVSNWQGHIDWRRVYEGGYRFAWVLATDGSAFVDSYLPEDVRGCIDAGIVVGAYHFARPARHDAATEARWFVDHVPEGLTLPPALDLESDWLGDREANTAWALQWFDVAQPRVRVIYTNLDGINAHLDSARLVDAGCRLWLAHPGQRTFAGAGAWPVADAVQAGQTPLPGVVGNVDFDLLSDDAWPLWSGADLPGQQPKPSPVEDQAMGKLVRKPDGSIWCVSGAGKWHVDDAVTELPLVEWEIVRGAEVDQLNEAQAAALDLIPTIPR